MKAYSYSRISTGEQRTGHGPKRQKDAIEIYCDGVGLELNEAPLTDLGLSAFRGTNMSKGALGEFCTAVQTGEISVPCALVVEDLDRISRQEPEYAQPTFYNLIAAGVEIHTTIDGQVYRKGQMAGPPSFYVTMKLGRGHEESAIKSNRHNKNWNRKREEARLSNKPMTRMMPEWLEIKSDATTITIIAERAAIVERIFRETGEGIGRHSIANRLNLERVEPWGRKGRKGMRWHESYITKILHNRSVFGEMQMHRKINGVRVPDGDPLPNYYPRILSQELWDSAHKSMKNRSIRRDARPDAPRNIAPSLIHIDDIRATWCDKGMRTTSGGKRGTKVPNPHGGHWIYYQARTPETGKQWQLIPALPVEDLILSALKQADGNTWIKLLRPSSPGIDPSVLRRRDLESTIQKHRRSIENLLEAIKAGVGAASIAAEIAREEISLADASKELEALGPEKIKSETIVPAINELRELASSRDVCSPQVRDALKRRLTTLFERIDIGRTPAKMLRKIRQKTDADVHETLSRYVTAPGLLERPAATGDNDKKMYWAILTFRHAAPLKRMIISTHAPSEASLAIMKAHENSPLTKKIRSLTSKILSEKLPS